MLNIRVTSHASRTDLGMRVWLHGAEKQPQNHVRQTDKWNIIPCWGSTNTGQNGKKFSRQGELAPAICSRLPYLQPNNSSLCPSHPITWRPMSIFFSRLRLGLTSFLFPLIPPSPPKPCVLPSPMRATWLIHLISLDLIIRITFEEEHKLWISRYVISPSFIQ